jgi:hypothetical protein
MDRYSVFKQKPSGQNEWRVYLHQFLAPDDAGHHNHPFRRSFSLVLWGSYTEEVLVPTSTGLFLHTRRVRWFNWITANKYHRITKLHPGPGARGVWTLFFAGPLSGKGWGFWHMGRHVPRAEYHDTGQKPQNVAQ